MNILWNNRYFVRSRALWVIFFLIALPITILSAGLQGRYVVVGKVPAPHSLVNVEYAEYFNFGCTHCNDFRKLNVPLLKKYKNNLVIKNIVVVPQGLPNWPARLFYIAERHGKGEEVKNMLFDAQFEQGVSVFDPGVVSYLARSAGLAKEYEAEKDSDWVDKKLTEANVKMQSIHLQYTPTVVLEGALKVEPIKTMDEYLANLDSLIGQLLKSR